MQQQYMDTLLRVERQNQKIETQLKMLSLKLKVKEDLDKSIQKQMTDIHAALSNANMIPSDGSDHHQLEHTAETFNGPMAAVARRARLRHNQTVTMTGVSGMSDASGSQGNTTVLDAITCDISDQVKITTQDKDKDI